MPAISGEPFRGLSKVKIDDGIGNRRAYTVSVVDVTPDTATGNQATWEGTPGSSLTLRFEWDTTGAPVFGQADAITIAARLPGDASNIGATWTPTITGNSGSVTQTFHFDDAPLDGSAGTNRAGMVELFLSVVRGAAVTWSADSRGGGSPPAATTHTWSRGYYRATMVLSAFSISNASLGGAEPASFASPDSIFVRGTMDAVWYRSVALALAARQSSTDKRTDTGTAQTGVTRDYTWNTTATTVAGKGRVNNGQWAVSSTLADIRFTTPSNVFGGTTSDKEYAWAASGHVTGFSPSGDNLDDTDRITVDPRVTFQQEFQADDNVFGTPPSSKDIAAGSMLSTQIGYLAARAKNARAEGLNGLVWTEKLWDHLEQVGSEASPVHSRSSTGSTKGGEAGWSDDFLVWDDSKPGGAWDQKEVITTTDMTGLEVTNTRTLTLLAADPRLRLIIGGGNISRTGTHWYAGQALTVVMGAIKDLGVGGKVPIALDSGTAIFILVRLNGALGRKEFFDGTDFSGGPSGTWKSGAGTTVLGTFTATVSPGDSTIYTYTFPAVDVGGSQGWDTKDLILLAFGSIGGVPLSPAFGHIEVVDVRNAHDRADNVVVV
jgi:hypothetical protein